LILGWYVKINTTYKVYFRVLICRCTLYLICHVSNGDSARTSNVIISFDPFIVIYISIDAHAIQPILPYSSCTSISFWSEYFILLMRDHTFRNTHQERYTVWMFSLTICFPKHPSNLHLLFVWFSCTNSLLIVVF